MQQIGIDCRFASSLSGLGRYTRSLAAALVARGDCSYTLFVRSRDEDWLQKLPGKATIVVTPFKHYSLAEQFRFPKIIKQSGIELVFSPHFNVPYFCPVPFVITIHDLILHRYPNRAGLLRQFAYRLLMARAVDRSKHIIAVSGFTASELASVYGNSVREKTSIVPEGVDDHFQPRPAHEQEFVIRKYGIQKPFFLYVGNAKEHKNVPMLLRAYASLPSPKPSIALVTGGKEASSLSLPDGAVRVDSVDESDLPALYSGAVSFVTASLYEGFGLPIVEAQACGCPVVAVRAGAIPEVADEHAVLVEPNAWELAETMKNPPTHFSPRTSQGWAVPAEKTSNLLGT